MNISNVILILAGISVALLLAFIVIMSIKP